MSNEIVGRLRDAWGRVPETWRTHIVSAWHTFLAGMATQLCLDLTAQQYLISFEQAAIISLLAAAVRAGVKATVQLAVTWWTMKKK